MYLLEFLAWHIQVSFKERGNWERHFKNYVEGASPEKSLVEDGKAQLQESVSETPNAEGSLYKFNDTYIEVSAGSSLGRRGFLTYMSILSAYVAFELLFFSFCVSTVLVTRVDYFTKSQAITGNYIEAIITPLMVLGLLALVRPYVWRLISWENLVQRRLLIRFNRVTRQVYLHRPRYAGGITVLDWESVSTASRSRRGGSREYRQATYFALGPGGYRVTPLSPGIRR